MEQKKNGCVLLEVTEGTNGPIRSRGERGGLWLKQRDGTDGRVRAHRVVLRRVHFLLQSSIWPVATLLPADDV